MPRKCPKCGEREMYVQHNDNKRDGLQRIGITSSVRRRYCMCENCGHKMTTYEIEAQDLRNIRDTLLAIRRKARLSKTVMGKLKTAIGHCQEDLDKINGDVWK